jgi:mono/diheme cytochrome c family protein
MTEMTRTTKSGLIFVLRGIVMVVAAFSVHAQGVRAPAAAASADAPTKSSIEIGRELFSVHCSRCHGTDGAGTANGPNLLVRVRGMSEPGFVSAVLQRYRWSLPAIEGAGESGARDAMIRGVLTRQESGAGMPAWESQPAVSQGVKNLYDYLSSKTQ